MVQHIPLQNRGALVKAQEGTFKDWSLDMLLNLIARETPSFPTAVLGPGTAKLVSHHQAMALALCLF